MDREWPPTSKLTGGLVLAEAVAMALATHLGTGSSARTRGAVPARAEHRRHRPLLAVLDGDASVRAHLSTRDLERLLDPRNYTGSASALVDRALSAYSTRGIAASGPPGLPPSDGFSEVDGAQLHYRIDGAGRAPCSCCPIRSAPTSAMWEPQIPALCARVPRAPLRHARTWHVGGHAGSVLDRAPGPRRGRPPRQPRHPSARIFAGCRWAA